MPVNSNTETVLCPAHATHLFTVSSTMQPSHSHRNMGGTPEGAGGLAVRAQWTLTMESVGIAQITPGTTNCRDADKNSNVDNSV